MIAYCYRSGHIYFRQNKRGLPNGAISLGVHRHIRKAVVPIARVAYNNKTLLVPGIPEATSDADAAEALHRFKNGVRERIDRIDRKHITTPV